MGLGLIAWLITLLGFKPEKFRLMANGLSLECLLGGRRILILVAFCFVAFSWFNKLNSCDWDYHSEAATRGVL